MTSSVELPLEDPYGANAVGTLSASTKHAPMIDGINPIDEDSPLLLP
jgi:hypothetical protein